MCVNDKSAVNEGSRTLCENGDTVISCDPVRYLPLILLHPLELRGLFPLQADRSAAQMILGPVQHPQPH